MFLKPFREETVVIPFVIFLVFFMLYIAGYFFDIFTISKRVFVIETVFLPVMAGVFLLYKKQKINYTTFMSVFIAVVAVLLTAIVFYNKNTLYRPIWFVAVIPFVYLYGGKMYGIVFSVLSVIVPYILFCGESIPISFQDYLAYFFTVLMISVISFFLILQIDRYEKNINVSQEKLKKQALYDPLTKIYNRRGFFETVKEKKGIIAVFDLDNFKQINDKYGHQFGDEYLRFFALLLKNHIRKNDIAARFGGDEFVVLFCGAELEDIKKWAEKFYLTLEKNKFKNEFPISVSSGFSRYNGEDLSGSFHKADSNLYKAKKLRNIFVF